VRGTTFAAAEWISVRKVRHQMLARIRDAEKVSGFKTGMRFKGDGRVMISITFYPSTKFWIQDVFDPSNDKGYGEARELTKEEYEMTEGLKL
jgi:hypothetical protein